MQAHPAADEFPMMTLDRLQELIEDIRTHGQREPITLCNGLILDGRNRAIACQEIGIEPQTKEFHGDPWSYVWSLNGTRRDLNAEQRYLIWKHCMGQSEAWQDEQKRIAEEANEKRSRAAKAQPRTDIGFDKKPQDQVVPQLVALPGGADVHKSSTAKATASKTNRGAVERGDALASKRPDLAEKVRKGEIRPGTAYRTMQHEEEKQAKDEAIAILSKEAKEQVDRVCDIRHCSMEELLTSGIKPNCIITDPPYPREYLPLYGELARLAKGVSLVAVMCGQSYFPEIMAAMTEHLTYRWMLAYLTPGGQSVQQWPCKVNTFWKPVILFGEAVEWIGDVTRSNVNDNDKRFHEWGQSESGMADLVERLSKPGDLICDPFCGGGTTALVSLGLGRRFVGCDIDTEHVRIAKERCYLQLGKNHG